MTKPVTLYDLSSDHVPVAFNITLTAPLEQTVPKYRCYARADWIRFQQEINLKLDLLNPTIATLDEGKIDYAIDLLTTTILEAEAVSVPEIMQRTYQTESISDHTRQLIALRNNVGDNGTEEKTLSIEILYHH